MKRILLTVSYWTASVFIIAMTLMSLDYCFSDALFVSMSFVPGGRPDDSWRDAPKMYYDPHPDKHFRR